MKQVKRRSLILLVLTLSLCAGLLLFLTRCTLDGRAWVSFFGGSSLYQSGAIYDRDGDLLYDTETKTFAEDKTVRKATMHLVGDANISTSLRAVLADRLSGYNPVTGTTFGSHDLYLTLDNDLCATAYSALKGHKGVVAVYNYENGDVYCLVSAPSFDPKNPPSSVDSPEYEGVYLHRFFSSTFPPGSVFKVVTTAAVIEKLPTWQDFRYSCTGSETIGGVEITCPRIHGADMTLAQAFARSCNGAYGQLALSLGGGALHDFAKSAGLLDAYEIAGITTATGRFDIAPAQSGDLAWSGSGQFHNLVNPAAFLILMGSIANEGVGVVPNLIDRETIAGKGVPLPQIGGKDTVKLWDAATCATLKELMHGNVVETYGEAQFGGLTVCAKSGTAEVGGGAAPHAWFTGFVEDPKYPLAFVVLVENGGSGANVAGSVAAQVLAAITEENN